MKTAQEWREEIAALKARMAAMHAEAGDAPLEGERAVEFDGLLRSLAVAEAELPKAEAREASAAAASEERAKLAEERAAFEEERAAFEERERSARVQEARGRLGVPAFIPSRDPFEVRAVSAPNVDVVDAAQRVLEARDKEGLGVEAGKLATLQRLVRSESVDTQGDVVARRTLVTENPAYRSAFSKLMSGDSAGFTPEEARAVADFTAVRRLEEMRAGMSLTSASGGYGVPITIDPTIMITDQMSPSNILDLARIENITTDFWRGITAAGMTFKFQNEAVPVTDGSPTLAQPAVRAWTVDGFIPFTFEIGMDYPGFQSELGKLLNVGYREILISKATNGAGDGSYEPTGLVTALTTGATNTYTLATAATFTVGDVNGLWAKLPIRYRNVPETAWMMDTTVHSAIQQLGTSLGAGWTEYLSGDGHSVLKGKRTFDNDYFTDFATGTGTQTWGVVGDFSNYLIAQRVGMNVEMIHNLFDPSTGYPTRQRGIMAWARVGAGVINSNGFAVLKNKAS